MRYRLQRHDGTDCSATMVPITVLRMVPIQRYRQDYVILPDMEKDSFPNWYGLCGRCKNGNDCNFVMTKDIEKSFFEELSVFYVAVTRAKKQVFFTASHKQLTNRGIFEKNYSCFMKLPGIEYIQTV